MSALGGHRRTSRWVLLVWAFLVGAGPSAEAVTCATTLSVKQAGGGDCSSIQACVNLVPTTLTGDVCVDIQDGAAYVEQVVVSSKSPTAAGYRVVIGPQSSQTPTVTPPSDATAAFLIYNASVTLTGMRILVSSPAGFGVDISSTDAILDRLSIEDPGNQLGSSAVRISTGRATIQNSTISVRGAFGVEVQDGSYSRIAHSSVTSGNGTAVSFSANVVAGGSNTVTDSFLSGATGVQITGSSNSSEGNVVRLTTITATSQGVRIVNNTKNITGNTIEDVYIYTSGTGLQLDAKAVGNLVARSTVVAVNAGAYALHMNSASSNVVTGSVLLHTSGYSVWMVDSSFNRILFSTVATRPNGARVVTLYASSNNVVSDSYLEGSPFYVDASARGNALLRSTAVYSSFSSPAVMMYGSSNTVDQTLVLNPQGQAMDITGSGNSVHRSSMTGRTVSVGGPGGSGTGTLSVRGASTTITGSFFQNVCQNGLLVASDGNSIRSSTMVAHGLGCNPGYAGVTVTGARNLLSDDRVYNLADNGNYGLALKGVSNTLLRSTVTAISSYGLYVSGSSSSTIADSYVEGKTGGYISNSTASVIGGSALAGLDSASDGLRVGDGSSGVAVSSSVIVGGASAAGVHFGQGNAGALVLSSVTIQGALRGLHIDTQSASASLLLSGVAFRDMAAASTGVFFGGGAFFAAFSGFDFASEDILVNVDALRLGAGSTITLTGAIGARSGDGFEHDPLDLVDWGGSLPSAPASLTGAGLGVSSIAWSWSAVSGATGYKVYLATDAAAQIGAPSSSSFTQSGLAANASYGIVVAAVNGSGVGPLSSAATAYTLAPIPSGLAAGGVTASGASLTWTGPATSYELQRSTGAGFSLLASTPAAAYADAGLSPGSTYYYRVRAFNGDGVATAYASTLTVVTLPVAVSTLAAPSGLAGTALSTSSILWTWFDNADNETGYRVLSGTNSLSGDLAAGATHWLQDGLGPDADSGSLLVRAFNSSATADSSSASRRTLAPVPSGLAAGGVTASAASLTWTGPASSYELQRSTGAGFSLLASTPAAAYADAGLSPGSTYYYRVRAFNGDGVATAYASTLTVVTLPLPGVPGAPAGAALGISSISWSWTLAPGATTHLLYSASSGLLLSASTSGPYVQTGLSPNTAYGLRAAGSSGAGIGPLSAATTVHTFAAVPASLTVSSAAATSLALSWPLSGNPAATQALLQRSLDGVVYSTAANGALTSYTDAGLLACTTYYYRVRNVNGDGVPTAYAAASALTGSLDPAAPSALSASADAGGTISLSWSLSPSEGVTGYRLYWDAGSGAVSYASPLAAFGSTATAFTTGVLTSSAAYVFDLRTLHRCGVQGSTGAVAMSGAAAAAAPVRAAIKEPDSGKRISGNRITVLGELAAGSPWDVQKVLFQYKPASSTAWGVVPAAGTGQPNPDFSSPYFTHWDVSLLPDGPYDLRAVAYDRDGVPDAAPPAVRVVVDSLGFDVEENDVAGRVTKRQSISNAVTSVIETAGAGSGDAAVRVTIPAGAVDSATATVSVTANPAISTAPPAGQTLVGSAVRIDLSNGQSSLSGTATITLTYPDTILSPSLLQIYYLDEATGRWSRDFASTVDTASRTVTGQTPHFSTFALLQGAAFAANLDAVRAYPVPYKPNGGDPDEGRPYSPGDASSGIIFGNLAAGSQIKIYTLSGRLVAKLDGAAASGTVRWDARNQDGRDAASGAYFAVITAPGHKSVVKKLVIIR